MRMILAISVILVNSVLVSYTYAQDALTPVQIGSRSITKEDAQHLDESPDSNYQNLLIYIADYTSQKTLIQRDEELRAKQSQGVEIELPKNFETRQTRIARMKDDINYITTTSSKLQVAVETKPQEELNQVGSLMHTSKSGMDRIKSALKQADDILGGVRQGTAD